MRQGADFSGAFDRTYQSQFFEYRLRRLWIRGEDTPDFSYPGGKQVAGGIRGHGLAVRRVYTITSNKQRLEIPAVGMLLRGGSLTHMVLNVSRYPG